MIIEKRIGRYLIERACDFDDSGRYALGDGWFVSYATGPTAARWFSTYDSAYDSAVNAIFRDLKND
jgi:hypothetical protein